MQLLNLSTARRRGRARGGLGLAATLIAATTALGAAATSAEAACPWVVQPYAQSVALASDTTTFDIVFDGLDPESAVFYGFTVASLDLAFRLANRQALPDALDDARRLEPKETEFGTTAYQIAPDTIQPHTIYLVAAGGPLEALEAIDARIEPARPVAVSELLPKLRGGTDWSGPLPHRSLPGFEIAGGSDDAGSDAAREEVVVADAADAGALQICAYQVAMR